jgi:hypothetical protein
VTKEISQPAEVLAPLVLGGWQPSQRILTCWPLRRVQSAGDAQVKQQRTSGASGMLGGRDRRSCNCGSSAAKV